MKRLGRICHGFTEIDSLGNWWQRMKKGEVFTNTCANKENLKIYLEEYLPRILCDIPLPQVIAVPAINPKTGREGLQIIYGEDFFEASYLFYENSLIINPENFSWPTPNSFEEYRYPKHISWNNTGDDMREQIFYTEIHVEELLSMDSDCFTQAQIKQLKKIGFEFKDISSVRLDAKFQSKQTKHYIDEDQQKVNGNLVKNKK